MAVKRIYSFIKLIFKLLSATFYLFIISCSSVNQFNSRSFFNFEKNNQCDDFLKSFSVVEDNAVKDKKEFVFFDKTTLYSDTENLLVSTTIDAPKCLFQKKLFSINNWLNNHPDKIGILFSLIKDGQLVYRDFTFLKNIILDEKKIVSYYNPDSVERISIPIEIYYTDLSSFDMYSLQLIQTESSINKYRNLNQIKFITLERGKVLEIRDNLTNKPLYTYQQKIKLIPFNENLNFCSKAKVLISLNCIETPCFKLPPLIEVWDLNSFNNNQKTYANYLLNFKYLNLLEENVSYDHFNKYQMNILPLECLNNNL